MKLEKIEKVNVADAVFEQMKQMILSGEWKSGQKLDGENGLAKQFGVSRISIRDAIHRLIGMGVLVAKHGDGTYVCDPVSGQIQSRLFQQLLLSKPQLKDVLEFRLITEVGSARLAAEKATEDDVKQLREIEKAMHEVKYDIEEFAALDVSYHNAIAVIAGNSLMIKTTAVVSDIYKQAMVETIKLRGIAVGRNNHSALTEAIEQNDSARAEQLMKEHIQSVLNVLPSEE